MLVKITYAPGHFGGNKLVASFAEAAPELFEVRGLDDAFFLLRGAGIEYFNGAPAEKINTSLHARLEAGAHCHLDVPGLEESVRNRLDFLRKKADNFGIALQGNQAPPATPEQHKAHEARLAGMLDALQQHRDSKSGNPACACTGMLTQCYAQMMYYFVGLKFGCRERLNPPPGEDIFPAKYLAPPLFVSSTTFGTEAGLRARRTLTGGAWARYLPGNAPR